MTPKKPRADIEDAYPLSPMQEGMLFHTLYAPGSGVYYEQIRYEIRHGVHAEHMREAWQAAMDRHGVLRTVFAWRTVERPLQVVGRKVKLDWKHLTLTEPERDEMLRAEITRGFDLSKAPLFRVGLYESPEESSRPLTELIVAFHHILLDMWSYSLIEQEVFRDYQARLKGAPLDFPRPRPYRDFIQGLAGADSERAQKFWRDYLGDFRGGIIPAGRPDTGLLGEDAPRDALSDFGETEKSLSMADSTKLRTFARENRLTLNTLLSGAWALLLRRHTRENDVLFGVTVSGRPVHLSGFETMTGLFINTLPVRVEVRDQEAPLEFMQRLQREQGALREHESAPLSRIVEWSGASDNRSLFDSILVVENIPESVRGDYQSLRIESVRAFEKTNYPLTIVFHPGETFRVLIKYDRTKYDAFAAEALLTQLIRGLEGLSGSARRLSEIQLVSPDEHARILQTAHDPLKEKSPARVIHELFSRTAGKFPGRMALSFQDRQWTYAELEKNSHDLARRLHEAGAGPESIIGLCLERSPELIIAMLAVLKSGGAYLPLDPDYPGERIAYIVADARPSIIIIDGRRDSATRHTFPREVRVLDLASNGGNNEGEGTAGEITPVTPARPDNLAYIIYTSGSTGNPKGVMVEHGHVADLFASVQSWARFDENDVWTLYHSASFDFSVWEIWGALLFGGRLIIVDYWTSRAPVDMAHLLRRENVSVFNQTPSAFRRFMEEPGEYPSLRLIIFGGEALNPADLHDWFRARGDKVDLVNMFGITETIVHVTHHKLRPADTRETRSLIGRPLAGKRVYILDEFMNPQPVGVPGEIVVGGHGIARGYLNQRELTRERFIPDVFAPGDATAPMMYRSGDLGRYLPEGGLEYLGRIDDQIKIRGFRIEPGEIEAALREHDTVEAAVVTAAGSGDEKYLVAYFTGSTDVNEARDFLAARLPEHMVPARFMRLEALPLTRNGKVDKQALPEPDTREIRRGEEHRPPLDDIERKLAVIWTELLKVEEPGRDDDFFRLGGDSILSIRMVSRAAKDGLTFSPRDVFEKPTIALLGEFLRVSRDAASIKEQAAPDAVTTARDGAIPLTPILSWFQELKLTNPDHYNMVFALRPSRRLDSMLTGKALNILVEKHDALRLRGAYEGGRVKQFSIQPPGAMNMPTLVVREFPNNDNATDVLNEAAREIQRSIDIKEARLLTAAYLRGRTSGDDRMLIAIHHIASDGVSWRILLEDLQEIYESLEEDGSAANNDAGPSFASWARRQSSPTREDDASLKYWSAQKDGRGLPLDFKKGRNVFASEKILVKKLDGTRTLRLTRDIPARTGFRAQEILVSALIGALRRWTGRDQIALHLESHGRTLENGLDPSRTIGWFTALYPLMFRGGPRPVDDPRPVRAAMRRVPDLGVSYGRMRYGTHTKALSATAEPDIVFNYLGDFRMEGLLEFAPEVISETRDPTGQRPHVLELNCFIRDGELIIHLHYSENLHARETMERLALDFVKSAEAIIAAEPARMGNDGFPLSPAQMGMLTESMLAGGSEMHVEQVHAVLRGPVLEDALEQAWRMVLTENPALRGGFIWRDNHEPSQFIAARAELSLEKVRLRREDLRDFLKKARSSGFDFQRPPLMRVALARLSKDEHVLVWTFHHILMDGWCLFPVLRRVFALYESLRENRPAEPFHAPAYRDFIHWLNRRDLAEPAVFFSRKLSGFSRASLPGRDEPAKAMDASPGEIFSASHGRQDLTIESTVRRRLEQYARENRLTMNSLMQGIWALLLARYNQSPDISFGITVSGRPPEIPDVEKTIGLFINTLPVRVLLDEDGNVAEMMREIQNYNLELREFEYSAGADVREWSGVPPGAPLFESILVYENYPFEPESFEAGGLRFDMETLESAGAITAYALTLLIMPGKEFGLRAIHDVRRMDSTSAARILEHMALLIEYIAATPAARTRDCLALPAEETIPIVRGPARPLFAEPAGETEMKLAELFREILGIEKIGRHDDFFALGGQSVLALRLAGSISAAFQRDIRVTALATRGTIAQLAPMLEGGPESEGEDAVLVPIQARGTRSPLFLVHPAGASPLCYAVLARRLGDNQPVYGLQPRGLEDDEPFITSIEDMAEHYIRRVREIKPEGPYRLGGWSLGGIIAYEMAVQLTDAGQEVEFLGMIDVTVEDHGDFQPWLYLKAGAFAAKSIMEQDIPLGWREWRHLLNFVGVDLPEDPLKLLSLARLPDPGEWLDALGRLGRVLARFYPIYIINMIAPMLYKPRVWRGIADLFRVQPYFWEHPDPVEKNLRDYARGGVRVHPIAGNHMTLMNLKNAPGLADSLRARLDELD